MSGDAGLTAARTPAPVLDAVTDNLNIGLRARHEFNTPLAIFAHLLEMTQQATAQIQ